MKRAVLAITSTLAFLTASGATAATICVTPPSVTTCPNHTIQAGVDAAAAGDTVKVAPGVYFEKVTVPMGKDNLQIIGAGRTSTILDPDVPNAGSIGIFVEGANGVKIANLGIRNGTNLGIGVLGNNVFITGVRVVGVHSVDKGAITVVGSGARIISNEVRGCGRDGIFVQGNSSVIRANIVAQIPRMGITAVGDQNQILGNKVANAGFITPYNGLVVQSGTVGKNVVSFNTLENIGLSFENAIGLYVNDPEPTVQSNKLIWAGQVQITCTNCNGGKVALNTLVGSSATGYSIGSSPLPVPSDQLLVQGNKVASTFNAGFYIQGPAGLAQGEGIQVLQNVAVDSSFPYDCFKVTGSGHTFTSNAATNCGGAGFYSRGDNFLFTSNQARGAVSSGFVVDGDNGGFPAHFGVTLNTNKASGSVGQGFALFDSANGGFTPEGTTGTGNTGLLNRQNFCNEGDATTIGPFAASTKCDIRQ